MSVIWSDFPSGQKGLYGTDTSFLLNGVWAEIITSASATTLLAADPDPNIGSAGYVVKTQTTDPSASTRRNGLRFALPTPALTEGFACRLWQSALPGDNSVCPVIGFRTAANVTILAIRFLSNGSIEARSAEGNTGSQYGVTTGPVVTANAWHHIEVKALTDAAAGTIEVRVNGVVKLNLSTLNTGSTAIGQIFFGTATNESGVASPTAYWKDVVFWDTSGTQNNNFLGSVSVYDQLETADSSFNWTASTGTTGWNLVDEGDAGPVDTDYISASAAPPAASIFTMSNLPADVTSVKALLSIARMEKTDGGDCTVQMALSPEGTNWDTGDDRPITTAYTYWSDVSELSPTTGVAWTPVEANSLVFRINRTT